MITVIVLFHRYYANAFSLLGSQSRYSSGIILCRGLKMISDKSYKRRQLHTFIEYFSELIFES